MILFQYLLCHKSFIVTISFYLIKKIDDFWIIFVLYRIIPGTDSQYSLFTGEQLYFIGYAIFQGNLDQG